MTIPSRAFACHNSFVTFSTLSCYSTLQQFLSSAVASLYDSGSDLGKSGSEGGVRTEWERLALLSFHWMERWDLRERER